MKIIIPGGSGQVGTILARQFYSEGHDVVILSRSPNKNVPWRVVQWNAVSLGAWVQELEGADVIINLTGRVVNCRYNYKNRCDIWSSRTRSVRVLGKALEQLKSPPKLWLQAGTLTIYEERFDVANDEYTGVIGGTEEKSPDTWRFSIDVARAWEGEFALVEAPKTRKVMIRSAMVMSQDKGGVFSYLLNLVKYGLGGTLASGKQYISWIHYIDYINAIKFLIQNEKIAGAVNFTSPIPLPNKDFMALLRKAWGQKFSFPTYQWMLEIGTFFMRTESELVLKSRKVVPALLLDAGFKFEYADWEVAAKDLCERWKVRK